MRKIRVLVVDTEVLVRRMLVHTMVSEPYIEVVGAVKDVEMAHRITTLVEPDLFLIGIDPSDGDISQTLAKLRIAHPLSKIVVLSPKSPAGAKVALEALEFGAIDFVSKPDQSETILFAENHLRKRLLPIMKVMSKGLAEQPDHVSLEEFVFPSTMGPVARAGLCRIDAVVIGASMGGTAALLEVIPSLPSDLPVPVIIVQHMPHYYTAALAELLDVRSRITVREVSSGEILRPGIVWIAPGGLHTVLRNTGRRLEFRTHRGPREHDCRPSINILFRSAAECIGSHLLAAVLSGTGRDGLAGCEAIRNEGGRILVQDERTALAWDLPRLVIKSQHADEVLQPNEIANEIIQRVKIGDRIPFYGPEYSHAS
jgi:two-component system chemotaxis response regulator CheB